MDGVGAVIAGIAQQINLLALKRDDRGGTGRIGAARASPWLRLR